jgi:hypothetical protein
VEFTTPCTFTLSLFSAILFCSSSLSRSGQLRTLLAKPRTSHLLKTTRGKITQRRRKSKYCLQVSCKLQNIRPAGLRRARAAMQGQAMLGFHARVFPNNAPSLALPTSNHAWRRFLVFVGEGVGHYTARKRRMNISARKRDPAIVVGRIKNIECLAMQNYRRTPCLAHGYSWNWLSILIDDPNSPFRHIGNRKERRAGKPRKQLLQPH